MTTKYKTNDFRASITTIIGASLTHVCMRGHDLSRMIQGDRSVRPRNGFTEGIRFLYPGVRPTGRDCHGIR